jgi:hypothetical protein
MQTRRQMNTAAARAIRLTTAAFAATVVVAAAVLAAGDAAGRAATRAHLAPAASSACTTWDPAWSPDGSQIAFGGSGGVIGSVSRAGTALHVLTHAPMTTPTGIVGAFHHDFQPAWSPSGRRLAYASDWHYVNGARTWDQWSLSVLDLTTGTVTLRDGESPLLGPATSRADPTWSRTGLLAYDLFDGPYLDPAGFVAGPHPYLYPGPDVVWSDPSWAPDGRRLVFAAENVGSGVGRIFVLRLADGTYRLLSRGYTPRWSPDGRWIAYRTGTGVSIRSPDGKRVRRLLTLAPDDAKTGSLVWSPGGARLAIGTTIVTVATGKTRELPLRYLGDYPGPSWSPDGRWLVYAGERLEIVHPDGTGYHTLDPCALTPSVAASATGSPASIPPVAALAASTATTGAAGTLSGFTDHRLAYVDGPTFRAVPLDGLPLR